jgi:hypothetical protein
MGRAFLAVLRRRKSDFFAIFPSYKGHSFICVPKVLPRGNNCESGYGIYAIFFLPFYGVYGSYYILLGNLPNRLQFFPSGAITNRL